MENDNMDLGIVFTMFMTVLVMLGLLLMITFMFVLVNIVGYLIACLIGAVAQMVQVSMRTAVLGFAAFATLALIVSYAIVT